MSLKASHTVDHFYQEQYSFSNFNDNDIIWYVLSWKLGPILSVSERTANSEFADFKLHFYLNTCSRFSLLLCFAGYSPMQVIY